MKNQQEQQEPQVHNTTLMPSILRGIVEEETSWTPDETIL